ncbi:MAG TPA: hypothetical protein VHI76_07770 [Solirubrobacterales bacterium]|jgi:hypothetical protein|nr:hypothetical protein [Solirubrobacterales bacterium]
MRRHGALGTASDLGIHDHGCWLYRGDAELRHAVVETAAPRGWRFEARLSG